MDRMPILVLAPYNTHLANKNNLDEPVVEVEQKDEWRITTHPFVSRPKS